MPVERDCEPSGRQSGERIGHDSRAAKLIRALSDLFDLERVKIENGEHELFQHRVRILSTNVLHNLAGDLRSEGIHLHQAVSALMKPFSNLATDGARLLNQMVQLATRLQIVDDRAESFEQLPPTLQLLFEGIQTFVIPASEHFLKTVDHERNMDMNFRFLSDAIQTPDALFQNFRINRQIEENEMMRELEVTALASDFGTEKNPGSSLFREPCGVAVALHESQPFVEDGDLQTDALPQSGLDLCNGLRSAADEQDLLGIQM